MPADGTHEDDYTWDPEEGTFGYDPEIVTRESLDWLATLHCLGFDTNAAGTSKSVFSLLQPN
jgi:hypothetical protein